MDPNDFKSLLEREPMPVAEFEDTPEGERFTVYGPAGTVSVTAPLPAQAADHPLFTREEAAAEFKTVREQRDEARRQLQAANERIKKLETTLGNIVTRAEEGAKFRRGVPLDTIATARRSYLMEIETMAREARKP